jgi:hypothetical protein
VASVSATYADITALQQTTASDSTNLSAAVDACAALSAAERTEWYALAARALAFVSWSPTGGSGIGVDAVWTEGMSVRTAMSAWPARLRAMGCQVVDLKQVPAAPPTPGPGLGSRIFDALEPPLVLLVLAVVLWERRK